MPAAALVPLWVLALGLAVDAWVWTDASRRAAQGRPVVFRSGSFVVDTPAMWLVGCLLLWVVFLPLYLQSRG